MNFMKKTVDINASVFNGLIKFCFCKACHVPLVGMGHRVAVEHALGFVKICAEWCG